MVRPVRPADLPVVLRLLHDLADYEFEPAAMLGTEEDLRRALFADQPVVFGHVAEDPDDGAVVGVAVWHLTFSTWTGRPGIHLVDLVVDAGARQGGHGRELVRSLAQLCVERDYRRLDWEVLDALEDHPGRRGPQGFYRQLGGAPRPGWTGWRLDGDALRRLGA
ncbi:GNAT family N-acetyltransferase [uncultured Jatrophihabitans sp.]|uniref:GNAT family N-acetyltransferase n=1 Tax=uncultured Jatrophihabitans sp. TaxID=1610747 RepID=UPI0035C989CF